MNKILFNLLIVGFAISNIQGASAMEDDKENSSVYRTPVKGCQLAEQAPPKPRKVNVPPLRNEGVYVPHIQFNGVVWDQDDPRPTSSGCRSKKFQ